MNPFTLPKGNPIRRAAHELLAGAALARRPEAMRLIIELCRLVSGAGDTHRSKSMKQALTVEGEAVGLQLQIKRLYLQGLVVKEPCPECGVLCVRDLGKDPALSYPTLGQPENLYGCCVSCEHEWEMLVVVKLTVEPAPQ